MLSLCFTQLLFGFLSTQQGHRRHTVCTMRARRGRARQGYAHDGYDNSIIIPSRCIMSVKNTIDYNIILTYIMSIR